MKANRSCRLKEDEGGMLFNLLLTAGITVIIFFALMSIGTYINGTFGSSLVDSYPAITDRSDLQNMTVDSLENVTANYNDALDIMTVTAIIMVITLPLAAIIGIKKLL